MFQWHAGLFITECNTLRYEGGGLHTCVEDASVGLMLLTYDRRDG
jgi:hypothetical protein